MGDPAMACSALRRSATRDLWFCGRLRSLRGFGYRDMQRLAPLGPHTRVVAAEHLASCKLAEEEVVILEMKSGVYFGLGSVGARIWELLREPGTAHEIQARLVAEYDVNPETGLQDTLALLEELRCAELVKILDEPRASARTEETASAGLAREPRSD